MRLLFNIYLASAFAMLLTIFIGTEYSMYLIKKRHPGLKSQVSRSSIVATFYIIGLSFCPVINTCLAVAFIFKFKTICERVVASIKADIFREKTDTN